MFVGVEGIEPTQCCAKTFTESPVSLTDYTPILNFTDKKFFLQLFTHEYFYISTFIAFTFGFEIINYLF